MKIIYLIVLFSAQGCSKDFMNRDAKAWDLQTGEADIASQDFNQTPDVGGVDKGNDDAFQEDTDVNCNSPRELSVGEEISADIRRGGEWDFNPCDLTNDKNRAQFYQIDIPLGGRYLLEIQANQPANDSLGVQILNPYSEDFSCMLMAPLSCIASADLMALNESQTTIVLDGTWGGGRDPAAALVVVSGSTESETTGYRLSLVEIR